MFDEVEQAKVFRRPEDLRITVEYLNPLFLVRQDKTRQLYYIFA